MGSIFGVRVLSTGGPRLTFESGCRLGASAGEITAEIPCCRKILACARPGLDPHAAHARRVCVATWHSDTCNEILAQISFSMKILATPPARPDAARQCAKKLGSKIGEPGGREERTKGRERA